MSEETKEKQTRRSGYKNLTPFTKSLIQEVLDEDYVGHQTDEGYEFNSGWNGKGVTHRVNRALAGMEKDLEVSYGQVNNYIKDTFGGVKPKQRNGPKPETVQNSDLQDLILDELKEQTMLLEKIYSKLTHLVDDLGGLSEEK